METKRDHGTIDCVLSHIQEHIYISHIAMQWIHTMAEQKTHTCKKIIVSHLF